MNKQNKTYVGAAVYFERLADDGWGEDGELWPLDVVRAPAMTRPGARVHGLRRRFLSHFVKSAVQSGIRKWRRLASTEI